MKLIAKTILLKYVCVYNTKWQYMSLSVLNPQEKGPSITNKGLTISIIARIVFKKSTKKWQNWFVMEVRTNTP